MLAGNVSDSKLLIYWLSLISIHQAKYMLAAFVLCCLLVKHLGHDRLCHGAADVTLQRKLAQPNNNFLLGGCLVLCLQHRPDKTDLSMDFALRLAN